MLAAVIVSRRSIAGEGVDRIALDVLAAWVEADCSERVEVACCLLHYVLQALNADDVVQELWPGTSKPVSMPCIKSSRSPRRCTRCAATVTPNLTLYWVAASD